MSKPLKSSSILSIETQWGGTQMRTSSVVALSLLWHTDTHPFPNLIIPRNQNDAIYEGVLVTDSRGVALSEEIRFFPPGNNVIILRIDYRHVALAKSICNCIQYLRIYYSSPLDKIHQPLPTGRDQNAYTLGKIGGHCVVVAVLPEIGNNAAATVVTQLLNDFPSIRFGLVVGIGGGEPGDEGEDDVRLGDVVVSQPTAIFAGVVQHDLGKKPADGSFERTGQLNKPSSVLSGNVRKLQAQHSRVAMQRCEDVTGVPRREEGEDELEDICSVRNERVYLWREKRKGRRRGRGWGRTGGKVFERATASLVRRTVLNSGPLIDREGRLTMEHEAKSRNAHRWITPSG